MQLLNECPLPLINAKGAKMSVKTHITVSHQAMRPSQHPRHITRASCHSPFFLLRVAIIWLLRHMSVRQICYKLNGEWYPIFCSMFNNILRKYINSSSTFYIIKYWLYNMKKVFVRSVHVHVRLYLNHSYIRMLF